MKKRKWSDEDLIAAVNSSRSLAEVVRALGLAMAGGTYKNIKEHMARLGLDQGHFAKENLKDRQSGKGRYGKRKDLTLDDVFALDSPYQSSEIRRYLFKFGYKELVCEECGLTEWRGQPAPLQVHHINGIGRDNRLENLKILCANCHCLTPNHGGKNKR